MSAETYRQSGMFVNFNNFIFECYIVDLVRLHVSIQSCCFLQSFGLSSTRFVTQAGIFFNFDFKPRENYFINKFTTVLLLLILKHYISGNKFISEILKNHN